MGRYIRRLKRLGSLGPSEEPGAGLWVGYELEGVDGDHSALGLISVDDWPAQRLAEHGVTTFALIRADDALTREKLGIGRNHE